jgi:ATP-dependent HslUV protease subunit HslV
MISGQGDVIEPSDGICAIGSGGTYALSAARALMQHTEMEPADICREAMRIAGEICVYTNTNVTVLELEPSSDGGR